METTTIFPLSQTQRCPRCGFPHAGGVGRLCSTCTIEDVDASAVVVTRHDAVHAVQRHFPVAAPTPTPETQPPDAPRAPATPVAETPATSSRQRHAREPKICAYEPCGQAFVPKTARVRFHSHSCSARWRVSRESGKAQVREAALQRASIPFESRVRAQLTRLEHAIAGAQHVISGQQARLTRLQQQANALRDYLAAEAAAEAQE